MTIEFHPYAGGVSIRDRIEQTRFAVHTDASGFEPADPDAFRFPVDAAVAVRTDQLAFPTAVSLYLRSGGEMALAAPAGEEGDVGPGVYEIEVSTAPVKLYLRADGPIRVASDGGTRLSFERPTTVLLGARSFHEHPAGTVTTTDDPRDAMRAVSTLGSALKTHSPERSFPTLRGHPPLIERGDRFEAPDGIDVPETGVRIEVPERHAAVYAVSTLAYYLGAEVVPGETPRLVAAGRSEPLAAAGERLSAGVQRTLEHLFALDCVVRTEGYYPVDLRERRIVEGRTDLDPAALYDRPLDERTAAYLDVPTAATDGVIDWHLTTDVAPAPENAEILPFAAADLSRIRNPEEAPDTDVADSRPEEIEAFYRGLDSFTRSGSASAASPGPPASDGGEADGGARAPTQNDRPRGQSLITPEPVDTVGHAWVGEGFPMGASKPTVESFRRRIDRDVSETDAIEVLVVCNDDAMREETADLYGFRDLIEFDVDVRYDVPVEKLRELLAGSVDFFHFVGHVDDRGMDCPDGRLDLRTLTATDVGAFLLNACRSYEQGMELVRAGALGGVVTTVDVANNVATDAGQTIARLLDAGFDLHGALDVTRETRPIGGSYSIVGNGGVTLCQSESGMPMVLEIAASAHVEEMYEIGIHCYPIHSFNIGSMVSDIVSDSNEQYVASGDIVGLRVGKTELVNFCAEQHEPTIVNEKLRWTDEVDVDDLRDRR